jgi:hypothetical protein
MIDATHFLEHQTPWGCAALSLPANVRMGQSYGRMGHAVLLSVAYVPLEARVATVQRGLRFGADSVGCVYEPQAWRMLGQPTHDDAGRVALGNAHGLFTAMAVCIGQRQHLLVRAADELWMRNDAERAVQHVQATLALGRADGAWVFGDQRFVLPSAVAPQNVTLHAEARNDESNTTVRLEQRLHPATLVQPAFVQAETMLEHLRAWQQHAQQTPDGLKLTPLPAQSAPTIHKTSARVAWRVRLPHGTDQCVARGCVRFVSPEGLGVEVEAFAQTPWRGAEEILAQVDAVLAGVGAPP